MWLHPNTYTILHQHHIVNDMPNKTGATDHKEQCKEEKSTRNCTTEWIRFMLKLLVCYRKWLIYFLLKEVPSDNLALPPVGVHKTVEHDSQVTAVWAWENTVVMFKQPGHLTSKKWDLGDWTKVFNLCFLASEAAVGCNKSWTKTC